MRVLLLRVCGSRSLRELDRIHVGTLTGPAGTFRRRIKLTKSARDLFAQLASRSPRAVA
jgi:hypothetical protein